MLSLKMLNGNNNGLQEPNSILLSASTARAIFGNDDPLNRVLKIDNNLEVKITGVYEESCIPRCDALGARGRVFESHRPDQIFTDSKRLDRFPTIVFTRFQP